MTEAETEFDDTNRTWTLRSAATIEAALVDPALKVRPEHEPIPGMLSGTRAGHIFGNLARMTDGEAHAVRRAIVTSIIDSFDLNTVAAAARNCSIRLLAESSDLNHWAVNVSPYTLGTVLGIDPEHLPDLARNAGAFARALSPGASPNQIQSGIAAADELWESFAKLAPTGGVDPDLWISNAIGLFFQAYDSMAGLLGNSLLFMQAHPEVTDVRVAIRRALHETPPIRNTRRFAANETELDGRLIASGSTLLLDLESAMRDTGSGPSRGFGAGPHMCPGQILAFTIAAAALEMGPRLVDSPPGIYPYPNANVPDFRGVPIPERTS